MALSELIRLRALCLLLLLSMMLSGCAASRSDNPRPLSPPQGSGAASSVPRAVSPTLGAPAGRTDPFGEGVIISPPRPTPIEPVIHLAQTRPATAPLASMTPDADGPADVTLNFVEANIQDIVKTILQDVLQRAYIIDPRVTGVVTLQTGRPLRRADLLPALDAILQLNGAALIEDRELIRIVPLDQALSSGARVTRRVSPTSVPPGFTILVLTLDHVTAASLKPVLEPFLAGTAAVEADAAHNLLLISGPAEQVQTLIELVDTLDADALAGTSFALLPLRSVDPETLVTELNQILGRGGDSTGPQSTLRFVPIERLNAVLVVARRPDDIKLARDWIDRLDRGGEEDLPRLYVYPVQSGRAGDLARVLGEALGASTAVVNAESSVASSRFSGEIGPFGYGNQYDRSGRRFASGDGFGNGFANGYQGGAFERPMSASSAPSSASETTSGTTPSSGEDKPAFRIIADETNNALIIHATPSQYRMVELALTKLDITPLQVLIEATIAEVSLDDRLRYGLEWFFRFSGVQLRLSDAADASVAPVAPGFSAILGNSNDARVVLNALQAVTDVNVVSSPQLVVLDNRTARLQVGDEVPIVTQSAQSVLVTDAPIVNSIDYRDTGVILEITPRVNSSGQVVLDILQEVSDVVPTTSSDIDSPTIRQRRVASTIAVQSGETVALGGLIRDSRELGSSGIPILSDLPVIGVLFGRRDNNTSRTELLILLTPRVVRNREDARAVTEELRSRLRNLSPNAGTE